MGPPPEPAPTYEPVEATKPTFKKYGYNPNKPTNPTIWRQQVMKVRVVIITARRLATQPIILG